MIASPARIGHIDIAHFQAECVSANESVIVPFRVSLELMHASATHISFPRLNIFEEVIFVEFVTSLWRCSTLDTMSELSSLVSDDQEKNLGEGLRYRWIMSVGHDACF